MFSSEDRAKLARLGVRDLLDLALIVPKRYEDRRPSSLLRDGAFQTLDVRVLTLSVTPRTVRVRLFARHADVPVEGVIFHPRPYHRQQFRPESDLMLYGKIERTPAGWQIVQPRIVTSADGIVPVYDAALAQRSLRPLIARYLTRESLAASDLPTDVVDDLIALHFPTDASLGPGDFLPAIKFVEITRYLRSLARHRRIIPARPIPTRDPEAFIAALPFTLTKDQREVIDRIRRDIERPCQTRRLIVGDVGCGKTVVMMAAAYMTAPGRTLIMAPTAILARQLYDEALRFLGRDFGIVLIFGGDKRRPLPDTATLIIGTHALLYADIDAVSLTMIDEQHRFGTVQRHSLALPSIDDEARTRPHQLQFSATPIPRTQAMIASELIDVSLIRQIPFAKQIATRIIGPSGFSSLLDHIRSEITHGRQVIIVYPLVEASDTSRYQSLTDAAPYWEEQFPGTMTTHGRDSAKEAVLEAFRDHGTLLLSTTVVEVGISLPRLSTIVIVGAERLGLATLHQLRGRVGRTGLHGYCYLFTKGAVTERLETFAATQSGFDIAQLDLRLRRSGDLVRGEEQSGKTFEWIDLAEDEEIIARAKRWLHRGDSYQ